MSTRTLFVRIGDVIESMLLADCWVMEALGCTCVLQIFFLVWPRWSRVVASHLGRYLAIRLEVRSGHDEKNLALIALTSVCETGEKQAA